MSDATDRIESDELRRQLARAWEAGYSAGWTDQLCDFPPHTADEITAIIHNHSTENGARRR